jgi:ribokinase
MHCGGKGLNQAIALKKAMADVYIAGIVGYDGQTLIDECSKNGIDTSCIKTTDNTKTGHAIIQIDSKGQNSIILYGGANKKVDKSFVKKVISNFNEGDFILLQNEINLLNYIIDEAYNKKLKIILNPSPFNNEILHCNLNKVDMFILNEVEGEQITNMKEPCDILKFITNKYKNAAVVLTLGENGACYADKHNSYKISSVKTDVVDTTAAGDTFTGYFLASIIKKPDDIQFALKLAATAASAAVSRKGASSSIPEISELKIL